MDGLAERVRSLRRQAGLSQSQLAAAALVSMRTVIRIEAGGRPTPATLHLIACALGVTEADLLDTNGAAA